MKKIIIILFLLLPISAYSDSISVSGGGGATSRSLVFLDSGTWTVPSGVTSVEVEGCAGGGGGGGAYTTGPTWGGGGGGSGEWTINKAAVNSQEIITITIGAGGTGGIGPADGIMGGSTSFGSRFTLAGGNYGKYSGGGVNASGGVGGNEFGTTCFSSGNLAMCGGANGGNSSQVGDYIKQLYGFKLFAGGNGVVTCNNNCWAGGGGGGGWFGKGADRGGASNTNGISAGNNTCGGGSGASGGQGGLIFTVTGGSGGSGKLIIRWTQ